ncbi:MAG TPA: heavy metal-binding domain-containing protein, partial [Chitinophagaceae bacterium]|nr:heavy metal-binding domain-containing protein [Chitinophagaceae bacterium]
MKSILKPVTTVILILTGVFCFIITNSFSQQKTVYQCPMKCEGGKAYDKPGRCPVCGMNLAAVQFKANENTKAETKSSDNSSVKIVGAMMNVMHKSELFGTISLDTI